MHSFFNQPYPWMYKGKGLWILAGAIFVMALFFNFVFEPFNVSYIVNTGKVTKVLGNAQGYLLTTCYPLPKLPVSRSMIPGFNARCSL